MEECINKLEMFELSVEDLEFIRGMIAKNSGTQYLHTDIRKYATPEEVQCILEHLQNCDRKLEMCTMYIKEHKDVLADVLRIIRVKDEATYDYFIEKIVNTAYIHEIEAIDRMCNMSLHERCMEAQRIKIIKEVEALIHAEMILGGKTSITLPYSKIFIHILDGKHPFKGFTITQIDQIEIKISV